MNVTGATRNWSWVNIGNPSKFDGTFEGGAVHLEWGSATPNKTVTTVTAATLTLTANAGARTFQSGQLVYDSPESGEHPGGDAHVRHGHRDGVHAQDGLTQAGQMSMNIPEACSAQAAAAPL